MKRKLARKPPSTIERSVVALHKKFLSAKSQGEKINLINEADDAFSKLRHYYDDMIRRYGAEFGPRGSYG